MITRILLDLDDVLNYCTMAALKYVGCPVEATDLHLFKPEWGWSIVHAANKLHPNRTFTEASFWQSIGKDFWANAPKSNECDWLIRECTRRVGASNVCILTAPTLDPQCAAGKMEWIRRNLPEELQRQFLIGPQKHFCARWSSLLIDDSDNNVGKFRANGGRAILVPRPWNSLNGYDPHVMINHSMCRMNGPLCSESLRQPA